MGVFFNRVVGKLKRESGKFGKKFRVFKKNRKKDDLKKDLLLAGIRPGDTVLVHSSLSKIGNVEGGASAVVEALLESVGANGNVIMPSYSFINTMIDTVKETNYIFDPLTTPSVVGLITETFRKTENVKRSHHPTHSVCAHGPMAEYITGGHFSAETNFGAGTPFDRLRELKGKMVGVAVDVSIVPIYHTIEDINPELYKGVYFPDPFPIKMRINKQVIEKKIFIHNPEFYFRRIDKNPEIEVWFRNYFRQKGILHEGNFGSGKMWWMDVEEIFDELAHLWKQGISIYDVPAS